MIFLFFFGLIAFVCVALFVLVSAVGLTLASLVTLLEAPRQIVPLLRDRRMRRNYALANATINVIEERLGPSRLAAQADAEGFVIRGGVSPEVVADATREALERLRAGEPGLAIHPRSGTTILAAQLGLALSFIVALALVDALSLLPVLAAILVAALLGPRVSPVLQRLITARANVGMLGLTSVEVQPPSGRMGIVSFMVLGPVYVRTGERAGRTSRPDAGTGAGPARTTLRSAEPAEIATSDYRVR